MQTAKDNITNLTEFTPKGKLGTMFAQARAHNQINTQLSNILPKTLNTLELCLIKGDVATLITENQAIAFRAQKQYGLLLEILTSLEGLTQIKKIIIKVSLNKN